MVSNGGRQQCQLTDPKTGTVVGEVSFEVSQVRNNIIRASWHDSDDTLQLVPGRRAKTGIASLPRAVIKIVHPHLSVSPRCAIACTVVMVCIASLQGGGMTGGTGGGMGGGMMSGTGGNQQVRR